MFARRRFLIPILALLGSGTQACSHQVTLPEQYQPSFNYIPTPSIAGRGISIALVNPAASSRLQMAIASSGVPELAIGRDTRAAIGRALVQYFTASGFTVSGPFANVEAMTFPEKKQADLVLTVEYDLMPTSPSASVGYSSWDGQMNRVESAGECTLNGQVSFVLWEPLSNQRMWAKSVEVPTATANCTIRAKSQPEYRVLWNNALGELYEGAYVNTVGTIERYFSPEEVALVKSQAEELRLKKVY